MFGKLERERTDMSFIKHFLPYKTGIGKLEDILLFTDRFIYLILRCNLILLVGEQYLNHCACKFLY